MQSLQKVKGPNYIADEALISVSQDGEHIADMQPQKRRYYARGSVMTEVALEVNLFRDLYVAMGEPIDEKAWAMRVHIRPFIRWIWLGALMMAFGACLAVMDKRYRKQDAKVQVKETSVVMTKVVVHE
jgi:cytochrome c-type biogenesis protein CcmF